MPNLELLPTLVEDGVWPNTVHGAQPNRKMPWCYHLKFHRFPFRVVSLLLKTKKDKERIKIIRRRTNAKSKKMSAIKGWIIGNVQTAWKLLRSGQLVMQDEITDVLIVFFSLCIIFSTLAPSTFLAKCKRCQYEFSDKNLCITFFYTINLHPENSRAIKSQWEKTDITRQNCWG